MKYLGKIQDDKDLVTKEYVDNLGVVEAPYKEVEWVESDGRQFIYLDWKQQAGWGFEADFIIYNAFSTTAGAISTANRDGYGTLFGARQSSSAARNYISTYKTNGTVYIGNTAYQSSGQLKTDGSRQTIKLHGTTYTKPNGTTMTVTNNSAPTLNVSIFAFSSGSTLPAGYSNNDTTANQYGTARIYSLKFYDSNDDLAVDLVGAYRKADKCTGLYDKISKHFYPAAGMLKGDDVGDLGDTSNLAECLSSLSPQMVSTNTTATRLWTASTKDIDKLVDGQQFILRNRFGTKSEAQDTELADKGDSGTSSNVYLKLTLSDGSTTAWIPCYQAPTGRLTSHYGAGSEIRFVYRENVMSGTYGVPRGFWVNADYNSTDTYQNRTYYNPGKAYTALYRYQICLTKGADTLLPINTVNNSTATDKTLTTESFNPFGEIYYYSYTSTVSAGNEINGQYMYYAILADFRYSFNTGQTLTAAEPVYLVCSPQSDGTAKLHSSPISQSLPTTEDGLIYIRLGAASDTYRVMLYPVHPVYCYKNGGIQPYIRNASTSAYGITKLSTSTSSTATDLAATPSAVKTAYDLANTANGRANEAYSLGTGALIYDQTYSVSGGVATFVPHVYQGGQEVTTSYEKTCFVWKARLLNTSTNPITISEVTLTTKNDRSCDVTLSAYGYGVTIKGEFTPPSS